MIIAFVVGVVVVVGAVVDSEVAPASAASASVPADGADAAVAAVDEDDAVIVPTSGTRDVTRAKKVMSAFMRGQGRVPFLPMPSFVVVAGVPGAGVRWGV